MKKYSQNDEQLVILKYFGGKKGTFLDLGAYNGVDLSNVRALAELGWAGVMVEASPTVFAQLKDNYEDFENVELHNCAIGDTTGVFEFYDNHNSVGTLHKHETQRWNGSQKFNSMNVWCYDINEFIDAYSSLKTFDFISCDIEGEDLNVISKMNFNALKTKMICVEWNGKDKHLYDEILLPYKFRLVHQNGENLIYYR